MANPISEKCVTADGNSKGLLALRQALVADVVTTGSTTTTPYGYTTSAQADAIPVAINAILDVLEAHGLMADA